MHLVINEKRKLFLSIPCPEINFACILIYIKFICLLSFGGISERIEPMHQRQSPPNGEEIAASKPDFVKVMANNFEGDFYICISKFSE